MRLRAVGLGAATIWLSMGLLHAQPFVAPGDTGSIEYPLENSSASNADLEDAMLDVDHPTHFVVKSASIRGPHSIPPAQTYSFVVEYEIAANAPEGSFDVTLKPRSPSESIDGVDVTPDLSTLDTQVSFNIADPLFLV